MGGPNWIPALCCVYCIYIYIIYYSMAECQVSIYRSIDALVGLQDAMCDIIIMLFLVIKHENML